MARKPKRKKTNSKSGLFKGLKSGLTGDKLKYTLGFFLLIFGLYLLIAFVSFLFYGHADHSKLDIAWDKLIRDSSITVENKAGKTGAFLSEMIINKGFGLPSFLIIYILIVSSLRLFGSSLVRFGKSLLFSLYMILWLSLSIGWVMVDLDYNGFVVMEGQSGFFLTAWLDSLIGRSGTFFFLIFFLFLFVIFGIENFIPWLKSILTKRRVPDDNTKVPENPELNTEDVSNGKEISKVITENDSIETIFDPDSDTENRSALYEGKKKEGQESSELEMTVEKHEDEVTEEIAQETLGDYDPTMDLSNYEFPSVDLLADHSSENAEVSNDELLANKNKIVETLRHYKIEITKIRATIGPTITLYEIIPAPGVRIAKIKNLEDDIALSLSALGIRIIAPIPGRGTIGIEVPNRNPEVVSMRSIIVSKKFQESTAELPVVIGKTISNETFLIDLVKMPHILVAGATGQGKSVGLNAIITSLLYKKHPSQLKLVLIDPKKVELSLFSSIENHFLAKLPDDDEAIITDIQRVKYTLNSLNLEMDIRYNLLKKALARNIKEYNKKFISRRLNPEKGHRYLPYIVVIIDEFADLVMTAGKEIELPIARIAQLARAVGIHIIIATQRPSTNIITGVIKANFPTRIAFKVAAMIDSRTILDTPGANQLIGKGDMLIASGSDITRLQCAFVDTPEVERICKHISDQPKYPNTFMLPEYYENEEEKTLDADLNNRDELFNDAAKVIVMNQIGSTSMIQRRFSIGYNRAGRIMDQLEMAGIVGPSEGSKARQVLIQDEYSLEQLLNNL